MEKSYPDWKILPAEILIKIFQFAATQQEQEDSTNFALVCKAWRNPAQTALYSHVTIYNIPRLKKFRDIVECYTDFGTKVKVLHLKIYTTYLAEDDSTDYLPILTNLLCNYLPNLEYLYNPSYEGNKDYESYVPILNALLNSKLQHLKNIWEPTYRIDGDGLVQYASCAFLMRDRLQEVYISNDLSKFLGENTDELTITKFQQLYDNLNQFNNLTNIDIRRQTDDGVQVLEHIVESCRSLRDIRFTLFSMNSQYDHVELENNIDFDTISDYIPRYNIKTLVGGLSMSVLENSKVLLYIMKKFPNLEKIYLYAKNYILQVTPYVILELLKYLVTIKSGCVTELNQDEFYQIIGNFWNTTSKPGIENVMFRNVSVYHIAAKSRFDIMKDSDTGTNVSLNYFLPLFDRQHYINFLEKNGKFIGDLSFEFSNDTAEMPENFLIHIFQHCLNLQNLYLSNFTLHKCANSKFDKTNKYSIDKFKLERCNINAGTLEQLSTILSESKELHLISNVYLIDDNEEHIKYRINMPQTKIQLLMLGPCVNGEPAYVKLFVVAEQKYYYYQSDADTDSIVSWETSTRNVKKIDEKLYNEVDGEKCKKFYVCCLTKPEIIFEYILLG